MFTPVEPQHAGPTALGILVPQGAKTLVIVRPRALTRGICCPPAGTATAVSRRSFLRLLARGGGWHRCVGWSRQLEAAVEQRTNPLESFGDAA